MIFITYIKQTGEIVAPVIQSNYPQNFKDVFKNNAEIFEMIYASVNVKLENRDKEVEFVKNAHLYKIDTKNNKIVKKETKEDKEFKYEEVLKEVNKNETTL